MNAVLDFIVYMLPVIPLLKPRICQEVIDDKITESSSKAEMRNHWAKKAKIECVKNEEKPIFPKY